MPSKHFFDVGPALYKCFTNVLCLLGGYSSSSKTLDPALFQYGTSIVNVGTAKNTTSNEKNPRISWMIFA